uniref:Nck-associated protein 5 n=1 Tax=Larimichthys crocea TaxID=215358 RepID=A0A0F8BTS2_LARCR
MKKSESLRLPVNKFGLTRLAVDVTCHVDVRGCLTSTVTLLKLQTGCNKYSLQRTQEQLWDAVWLHKASQVCESPEGRRAMNRHLERREHLKRLSLDSSIPEYMDANKCIDELLKQLEEERRNVRSGLSVTSIRSHGPNLASPAVFCLLEQMAFLCDPFHTLEDEEG